MRDQRFADRHARSWFGALGLVLIAAGLIIDRNLIEATVVADGRLGSPLLRAALIGAQLASVLLGLALLAAHGVRRVALAGAVVVIALLAHGAVVGSRWHTVLDCRSAETACFATEIDRYYGSVECHGPTPDGCRPLREGINTIAFVADATNYVSGRVTSDPPVVEVIDVDLREPWDLEVLPDGALLITELGGRVVRVDASGTVRTVLQLEPLLTYEVGLMGMALDPDFPSNRYVYLYYTTGFDISDARYAEEPELLRRRVVSRISRFALSGDSLVGETVLLDAIPGSAMHAGGRLETGPDGMLYATTGDAHDEPLAEDPQSLIGKVLRIALDGSVPADNPLPGSHAFSSGHRNPQGLAWHPDTGELYETENGPDRFDELNRIRPGANYGWPGRSCSSPYMEAPKEAWASEWLPPLACYEVFTLAPSGMTFVADPESRWHGSLFVAGMRGRHLRRYELDGDRIITEEIFFIAGDGTAQGARNVHRGISRRLRDVKYHDGALYVIGDGFGLVRLRPRSTGP
jgi:aldose sugar dehydrogenase